MSDLSRKQMRKMDKLNLEVVSAEKLRAEVLRDEDLENIVGGIDWNRYGQCILDGGGEDIPALSAQVEAINAMDWTRVAIESVNVLPSGIPLVVDCWNAC